MERGVDMKITKKTLERTLQGALLTAMSVAFFGCAREPVSLRIAKGQEELRNGEHSAAARHFRSAIRTKTDSALLFFNLGMAEFESRQLKKAAHAFARAAELTTDDNTDALEALARVRHLQRRWDDANAAYEKALQKAGRRPRILAAMAATELQSGSIAAAGGLLTEALAQNPDELTAIYNMACLHRDGFQDAGAAVAYFTRFLSLAPESESAARLRAEAALEALGDVSPATSGRAEALILQSRRAATPTEAASFAEQAVNEDPLSADTLWNLASILEKQVRDSARAGSAYGTFIRLFPKDSRVQRIPAALRIAGVNEALAAARTAEATSNWDAAALAYRQALSVAPSDADIWVKLSDVYRTSGGTALALAAALKAQELRPNDADAEYRLGYLYLQQGQQQKAVEHYRRYLRVAPEGSEKEIIRQWLRATGG